MTGIVLWIASLGCILQGSAVLVKRDGGYRKGYVGGIFYGQLEVFQFGQTKSTMKNAANVILDEKPNVHERTKGTLKQTMKHGL